MTVGWANSEEGRGEIRAMIEIEEQQLTEDPSESGHLVACGTLKPVLRVPTAIGVKKRAWIARRRLRNLFRAGSRLFFQVYWIYFKIALRAKARTFRHVP